MSDRKTWIKPFQKGNTYQSVESDGETENVYEIEAACDRLKTVRGEVMRGTAFDAGLFNGSV